MRHTTGTTAVNAALTRTLETGHADCEEYGAVLRTFRDLAATLVVLIALFGTLMLIDPRVREQFGQITGEVQGQGWSAPEGPIGSAAEAAVSITSNYASDNPFLFSFAVVAVVIFMLMLRT